MAQIPFPAITWTDLLSPARSKDFVPFFKKGTEKTLKRNGYGFSRSHFIYSLFFNFKFGFIGGDVIDIL